MLQAAQPAAAAATSAASAAQSAFKSVKSMAAARRKKAKPPPELPRVTLHTAGTFPDVRHKAHPASLTSVHQDRVAQAAWAAAAVIHNERAPPTYETIHATAKHSIAKASVTQWPRLPPRQHAGLSPMNALRAAARPLPFFGTRSAVGCSHCQ